MAMQASTAVNPVPNLRPFRSSMHKEIPAIGYENKKTR
ncbi:hypothetical protein CEV33_4748 [Brucella grignonensis]|uniref:Uncharacterized protein n=1 Tax=Brucella grignonensis TaxID=94627 RepID=A0A256G302_9HYPH|nr:hypothetical protein CEV33_4748 [Brucella grignonensis]